MTTITFIAKEDLIDGFYYLGESSETHVAKWNKVLDMFEYISNREVKTTDCFTGENDNSFMALMPVNKIDIEALKNGLYVKQ